LVDVVPLCTHASASPALLSVCADHLRTLAVRHIPDWVPGAGFKKTANAWAATLREMVDLPHNFVKQQMVGALSIISRAGLYSGVIRRPALPQCPSHRACSRTNRALKKNSTSNGLPPPYTLVSASEIMSRYHFDFNMSQAAPIP
jgi:hypothetical protein